jgi:hypothetical protein
MEFNKQVSDYEDEVSQAVIAASIEAFYSDASRRGCNSPKNKKIADHLSQLFSVAIRFEDDRHYAVSDQLWFCLAGEQGFVDYPVLRNRQDQIRFLQVCGNSYYDVVILLSDLGDFGHLFLNRSRLLRDKSNGTNPKIATDYLRPEHLSPSLQPDVLKLVDAFRQVGIQFPTMELLSQNSTSTLPKSQFGTENISIINCLFGEV